jgi:hypothetical protein
VQKCNKEENQKEVSKKMPRSKRRWISQLRGSFHIISRVTGGELLLKTEEKEYLLKLLVKWGSGILCTSPMGKFQIPNPKFQTKMIIKNFVRCAHN